MYSGFLFKAGNYTLTGEKYIKYATYSVTRKIQDLDSYRDANGVLHRNALTHTPLVVAFETPSLTNTELTDFLGHIQDNYINAMERRVQATVYVPELDEYMIQDMYLVEPEIKIKYINPTTGVIIYEPLKISFVGY